MHWLSTKHVGALVGMIFGFTAAVLGFASNRKRKMGERLPGWVLPAVVSVLVVGCFLVCVAKI